MQQAAPPPPPPPASRPVSATVGSNGYSTAGAQRGKPTPPAPPAKRPLAKKAVALPEARDSGYSASSVGAGESNSGSMAGSLAEALRARQAAMNSQR